jgi:type III secretory pathway component EscR
MKYIFLHIKDCEREKREKKLVLIFLWNWEFKNLWKDKYQNIDKLKENFSNYEIPNQTKKWKVDLKQYKEKIKQLANNMNIWFFNYTNLKSFCLDNIEKNKNDEILIKLLSWVIEEINKRELK